MWLDKVADIFRQAFSPLGLKRPREDRLPTDGYKETVHASKRPAAAYNGNGKEPMQIKSVRIEEANNGEYMHGSKAYEWREFPSPSTRQISNPHQMKDDQEEIPNHPLVVKVSSKGVFLLSCCCLP